MSGCRPKGAREREGFGGGEKGGGLRSGIPDPEDGNAQHSTGLL